MEGWIDLTEPVAGPGSYVGTLPATTLERLYGGGEGEPRVSWLTTTTHSGTHIDAPRHFFPDGPAINEIPLERFHGIACVKRLEVGELHAITPSELERGAPSLRPGEMLFVSTGWDRRRGTPAYERHPYLSAEAAAWIVAQEVAVLGVDVVTPDMPIAHRPPGHKLAVHDVILRAGIPIIEQLRLSRVAGLHVEATAFPLSVWDGDGAPARVAARATRP